MELRYLLLIITIFISACIETDIYLPAFPDMMNYFSVSEEMIQKLLTWNFFGICLSGPIYGPVSDSIGRKRPLMIALGLFFAGSIMTLVSPSFEMMLWGRLLQGLGSGGCFTLGTAVIFDAFKKEKAIRALSHINSIVPFLMAGAPLLGGYLNLAYGFRSNFLAIAIFVFLSLAITLFFYEETLPMESRKPLRLKKLGKDFKAALTCLPFWQMTFVVSFLFGSYIAFLSTTSVLFVLEFGVNKTYFPLFQASILAAWLVASLTCTYKVKKWGTEKIKNYGIALLSIGGSAFVLFALLYPTNPYLVTFSMTLITVGINWVQGVYFPEGMELLPEIKGVTASLLNSFRLLFSAIIVGTVSSFYNGTINPLLTIMVLTVGSSLVIIYFYEKGKAQAAADQALSEIGYG